MPEEIRLFAETGHDTGHTHEAPAAEPAAAPQLVFGSAEEFLHEQLLPTYIRDIDDRSAKWCLEWYFHPEAVSRVEALWRSWEHLRLDGATSTRSGGVTTPTTTCASSWTPKARSATAKSGHRDPAPMEPKRAPTGWFPDVRLQG